MEPKRNICRWLRVLLIASCLLYVLRSKIEVISNKKFTFFDAESHEQVSFVKNNVCRKQIGMIFKIFVANYFFVCAFCKLNIVVGL